VTIVDVATLKPIGRIGVGRNPNWVAFTPDGRLAVISNTGGDSVTLVDTERRKVTGTVRVGSMPKRLAVGLVESGF